MKAGELIYRIKERLIRELPGRDVQFLMAPPNRKREMPAVVPANAIKSAVMILIFPKNNSLHFVLTQRQDYQGTHGGQISLPGGRADDSDPDLQHTALRECFEEIGVLPDQVEIIGELSEIYIPPSNFVVSPFVGYLNSEPRFQASEREVKQIVVCPLLDLLKEDLKMEKIILQSGGIKIQTPYFEIEGLTVWGATAMILSELNAVVRDAMAS